MYKMRFLLLLFATTLLITFSHGDRSRGGDYYRRISALDKDRPPEYPAAYPMFCSPLTPKMYNHPTVLKDLVTLFEKLQKHRHFAKEFHNFIIDEIRLEMDNESVELGRPDRPPQERPGGPDRPSGSPDADFIRPTRPQSGRPNLVRPGRPGSGLNRPGRPHGRPGRPQGRPQGRPGRPGRPLNPYDRPDRPRDLGIPIKRRRPDFGQRFVSDKQRLRRPPAPSSRSWEEDPEESQEYPEDIDEELSTEDYSGENRSTEAADSEYSNEDDISIEGNKMENFDNFYE